MLVMLLVGVGTSWAANVTYSFTINTSNFEKVGSGTGYTPYNGTHEFTATATTNPGKTMTIEVYSNQVMVQSSNLQGQKNAGYLYNKTDLGKITNIEIGNNSNFTSIIGNSENPSSAVANGGFFNISASSSTSSASTITITFVVNEGGESGDGGDSGDGYDNEVGTASFIFNTDAGLSALGITKPAQSAGTNLGSTSYTSGNISMTTTNGGTATRVWNSQGNTSLRVYSNGGSLTFSGATITKIAFNSNVSMTANVGSLDGSIWTGESTSVTFTATSGVTINTIEVTYESDGKTTPTLSFANPTYNATMGEAFTAPTLNNPQGVAVTYSSSDKNVATVNESTGAISLVAAGKSTITASYDGSQSDKYNSNSASYELVVAAAPNKYAVTTDTPANGTLSVTCDGEDIVSGNTYAVGKKINIVATPADGYKFRNIQVVDESTHTFTASNEKEWTMAEHEISITANFDEIPTYTIAWSVNGVEVQSDDLKEGSDVTVPENPADINGKTFTGWIETASVEGVTPAYVTPSATAKKNVTYYAVFATHNSEATPDQWQITNLSALTSSDVFVMASGTNAISSANGTSGNPAAVALTVSAGNITSEVTDAIKWTLTGNATDGYTFYKNGSTVYLYVNTTASSKSNTCIRVGTQNSNIRNNWKPDDDGYLVTNDTYTARYLSFYSDGSDFRGYVNTDNGAFAPTFYKLIPGEEAYSDFTTTPTPVTKYDVTILDDEIENGTVTADPATAAEGETVTLTITPDDGYTLAQLMVYTDYDDVEVVDNKFVMPASDVEVYAYFALAPSKTYTLGELAEADIEPYSLVSVSFDNEIIDIQTDEEYGIIALKDGDNAFVLQTNYPCDAEWAIGGTLAGTWENVYYAEQGGVFILMNTSDDPWAGLEYTLTLALDENAESIDEIYARYDEVTVTRTLKAGIWNTLCLPFSMTADEITANFGEGAVVKELSGLTVDDEGNFKINFSTASEIAEATPYLVKVENAVSEINVTDKEVLIDPTDDDQTATVDDGGDNCVTFHGNYGKTTIEKSDNNYVLSSNKFYFVNSVVTNKGFRGWFETFSMSAGVKALTLSFEDNTTAVKNVTIEGLDDDAVFDLTGRKVAKAQKGVYIKNGRKFLTK